MKQLNLVFPGKKALHRILLIERVWVKDPYTDSDF